MSQPTTTRPRYPSLWHGAAPAMLALLLLLPTAASALPEDRDQPIELEADSAEYDQRTGISVYRGNVVVNQGTMRMTADVARLFVSTEGTFERMEAEGAPATFRYQPSLDRPEINGVGRRVDYVAADGKVVVSGQARFVQGGDEFTGERVEYDIADDTVRADGGEGRVRFLIQPRRQP